MGSRLIFIFAGLVIVVGAAFMARRALRGVIPQGDPRLEQLQKLNPHLTLTDEFDRVPIYWIVHPDGRRILLPIEEVEGSKVTLLDCAAAAIPPELLYPNRTELTCLELARETRTLRAFFFQTKDPFDKTVTFYEAMLPPERRFGSSGRWIERKEASYRLYVHEDATVKGFVAY